MEEEEERGEPEPGLELTESDCIDAVDSDAVCGKYVNCDDDDDVQDVLVLFEPL